MPSTDRGARYHHGDLRRALLAATLELLEAGEEPTLRAVARRAGVSHTAPYHHFADRRALVAAVAEEALGDFRGAMLEAAAGTPPDPGFRLLEIGVAYVRFAVGNPARFRLMFSAELADRSDLPALQAAYADAYAVLLDAVRAVMGSGASDAAVGTRALAAWSVVHGLSMLLLDNQVAGTGRSPDEVERVAREVLMSSGPGASGTPPPAG